jgi:hypothetical protein
MQRDPSNTVSFGISTAVSKQVYLQLVSEELQQMITFGWIIPIEDQILLTLKFMLVPTK